MGRPVWERRQSPGTDSRASGACYPRRRPDGTLGNRVWGSHSVHGRRRQENRHAPAKTVAVSRAVTVGSLIYPNSSKLTRGFPERVRFPQMDSNSSRVARVDSRTADCQLSHYPVPRWSTKSFAHGHVPQDASMSRMVPLRFGDRPDFILIWASRPGFLKHDFIWYSRSRAA